ncbi:MAG TPA: capsule assembly Wzi family protein, partial [Burkholderiaceae bacterium]|nr:capsule assembly Wzi family protein [Burkholderiaceae bacterium]
MPPTHAIVTCTMVVAWLCVPARSSAAPDAQALERAAGAGSGIDYEHASRGTGLALLRPPDGLTLAADGPSVDVPWILSPLVRGTSGAQALWTVRDQSEFLLRLGVGWANVQSTGVAPPFQEPPSHRWTLDGTELAWRFDGGEFYASMQRRNWGPGWTGSLILDGAAQAMPAVGWRRPEPKPSEHPWLSWMGPWSADVFFGRLFGHDQPERPDLIGMRLQIQPFEPLQIGLSRTMQWGGHGRDESLQSLWNALIGNDNVGRHGITAENEPGNQLGGFDFRWQLGADPANAIYAQAIGEDQRGGVPSAYIAQLGLQAHWNALGADWLGFVEWNDLIASHAYHGDKPPGVTYASAAFKRGYTHDRMPIGHPVGGDVTLGSVGLLARIAAVDLKAVVSRGDALPTSQRFAPGRIWGFNGSAQIDIEPRHQIGAGLWWWQDSAERQRALQLWWSLRL